LRGERRVIEDQSGKQQQMWFRHVSVPDYKTPHATAIFHEMMGFFRAGGSVTDRRAKAGEIRNL
jgi:hypothetical protein